MSLDEQILSSDINNSLQINPIPTSRLYHTSACGSILYSTPTNNASEIFSFLRHGNFEAFRRSFEVYYQDIIQMRNQHGQVNLIIQLKKNLKKTKRIVFFSLL